MKKKYIIYQIEFLGVEDYKEVLYLGFNFDSKEKAEGFILEIYIKYPERKNFKFHIKEIYTS